MMPKHGMQASEPSECADVTWQKSAQSHSSHAVNATPDVNTLVPKFKSVIGTTWTQAISPNNNSHVTKGPQRQQRPWVEVRQVMARTGDDEPATYIRNHVSKLTGFFSWEP